MIRIKNKDEITTQQFRPYSTLHGLAKEFQKDYEYDIVLCRVDGKLTELRGEVAGDTTIEWITAQEQVGRKAYRRSVLFMLLKALDDVTKDLGKVHVSVNYSINQALYCEFKGNDKVELNQDLIDKIKARMDELVQQDIPIIKQTLPNDDVVKIFRDRGMEDKAQVLKYRRVSRTNVYYLEDYVDYFYGYMVPSTGYLKYYDIMLYEDGFMLVLPAKKDPTAMDAFKPQPKLFNVLKQAEKWGDMLEVGTVGALNDLISKGGISDMVLVQEALMERNIGNIASRIADEQKKVVLIAGPSSSGKTTFSHRLSIQLRANGLHPHPIAMDNYFVNREETPVDEEGNYDFECIEAMAVDLFNENMSDLVKGKKVEMPTFNFKLGKREYKGNTLQLGKDDVLVIEGIHGLNPVMSNSLSDDDKFKIYISALTQLNIDEHNRIPTTDGRLIRRIVRDAKHRGTSAKDTIAMWPSVRRGEELNIFPYQEEADAMFNSALIYELAVLKQYAEPLLFAIPKDCREYQEATRLLKFFDYFLGVSSDILPNNSIIREFIGGSYFNV
ncbi:MAG: nucleoside kinase [Lachnospiraceae bacterium]|nr:nucleoside kinase [Lachnospiraceae bacterium]